ncbi:minor capsid protein [Corallococcus sp. AS-1-6]|uniref:minor capsid protein n=1 Tax=Corallococcus sp. AS-1-6 TaxID=2874599 RepID=UPI001CBEF93D|nr:minor capsid protein [Corallococcus sp. AS-1-6]MBZ4371481.1 minor capsid protein [Corallococcus sp. AS-1-6]
MASALTDVELHVAQVLDAAALGVSRTATPPSLYMGPMPLSAPPLAVAVREVPGDAPEDYMGTGRSYLQRDVQVLVRGRDYLEAQALARECWRTLHLVAVSGYVSCRAQGLPSYLGEGDNHRHRFVFTVTLAYAA